MTPEPRSANPAQFVEWQAEHAPLRRILPNEKRVKSLRSNDMPGFNGGMKIKMLTVAVLAGCMLGCATPKPTLTTATGTVCSCTKTEIVMTEGNYYWVIQRTPTTRVISGTCSKGSTVTVEYNAPDAQRKEGPCPKTRTPQSS